ncbi:hypothetical protein KAU19_03130 [Candidatus Parcubacteria bacterium]|nr:hypothetical protein [Candidatus Parcubacteria bacterium]
MLKINKKIIFACLCAVIIFNCAYYLIKASPSAQIQFTADTIISLSGIDDGDLYIRTDSECAEISISGAVLTITDIPDANNFILKTTHNNALKLTPSGGVLDLTLDSGNISSGDITQWTLNASSGTTVAHIVGVSNANTWHAIKADSVLFNSYQSSASGEVSFTYDGSWSEKVFTIEVDSTAPTEFSLVSPVSGSNASDSKPTFSWNASSDPDVSYYQLYIDGSLDTNNITGTSVSPSSALSCGSHSWYVRAVDNAGNTTDSGTFNLSIICGSTPVWLLNQMNQPADTIKSDSGIGASSDDEIIKDENVMSDNKTITGQIEKSFAYRQPRLKSLAQEQNFAKILKQLLEQSFGINKIPLNKKYWHIFVNAYVYGNYPVQVIKQAIKFHGKTVHPDISFSAWQRAKDYLEWIGK